MNTTPQDDHTFEATVIRVTREAASTRGLIEFAADLTPGRKTVKIDKVRTGRTDNASSGTSRILGKQLQTLVGHRVAARVRTEKIAGSRARVRRIVGVIDLGLDPNFIAGDPRTIAEEPLFVPTPNRRLDIEVEFTGEVIRVSPLTQGFVAIQLKTGPEFNVAFMSHDADTDAEARRAVATSLIGKRATVTGMPDRTGITGNVLALSRIVAAS